MENQVTRNAFSLDFKREVDVALCILRLSILKKFGILKSYTKIHTADLRHFITGNGLETKISRTFIIEGMNFASLKANFMRSMPGMPNPMQLASQSACPACQTGRVDRRVTSNNPRKNCGTHFGSSPLLVTKVANGKVYLPEISVCNKNLRRRLKLKNEYR